MRSELSTLLSSVGRYALAALTCALPLLALAACEGEDLSLGDGNRTIHPEPADPSLPVDSGEPRDSGAAADPPPATPADPRLPEFGAPRPIEELADSDKPDDDPSLSADRLLLCFNSRRDGGAGREDVWCAERERSDARWQAPEPLQILNSDARETGIALAPDGLRLWFSSDRAGGDGGLDVYLARRDSRQAGWSAPERVLELSTPDDDLVSAIDASGQHLVLARRVNDDDDYEVLVALRDAATDHWQAPQPIAEINSDDEESDGFLVGDGLQLIFTRDGDLMLARRDSARTAFDTGSPIASLNSEHGERDAWADSDLTYVIFSSDRDGEYRLYEAWR